MLRCLSAVANLLLCCEPRRSAQTCPLTLAAPKPNSNTSPKKNMPRILFVSGFHPSTRARDLAFEFERYVSSLATRARIFHRVRWLITDTVLWSAATFQLPATRTLAQIRKCLLNYSLQPLALRSGLALEGRCSALPPFPTIRTRASETFALNIISSSVSILTRVVVVVVVRWLAMTINRELREN
jgi:hypothetical protein